jgi:thioredoxin reductase (NADPH)
MRRAGLPALIFDRSCIVSGIVGYPTYMTFFSTAERLAIGGIPFVVATEKPTRRDALAYYREVARHFELDVRQYENVERIDRDADGFVVHTTARSGRARTTRARAIVIATGYFGMPNRERTSLT